jgi:hypothetical protein
MLPLIAPSTCSEAARELVAAVQRGLGVTSNMTKAKANSPALLEGYLLLSGALGHGARRPAVRERVVPATAQNHPCNCCRSAHPSLADHVAHVDADDVAAARSSEASDTKTAALLSFRREASINDRAIFIDPRRVVWRCSPEDLR